MTVNFSEYISLSLEYPALFFLGILIFGVLFVHGWTDAANSVATCIATRTLEPNLSLFLAAISTFLGVLVMVLFQTNVMESILHMVNLGEDIQTALWALCAVQISIILWSVGNWYYGIPTSESHGLIAGLSGAAIALHQGLTGIQQKEWTSIFLGFLFTVVLSFFLGYLFTKMIQKIFQDRDKEGSNRFFRRGQIFGLLGTAFMQGAQGGQKFIAVFLLALSMAKHNAQVQPIVIPVWLLMATAMVFSVGTSMGGYRIIKNVGMRLIKMRPYEGFSADASTVTGLVLSTIIGSPVSATLTKNISIMGVGAAKRMKNVNWNVSKEMLRSWILTFPICGILAYLFTNLLVWIF